MASLELLAPTDPIGQDDLIGRWVLEKTCLVSMITPLEEKLMGDRVRSVAADQ